jgi:hypothetical protein
VKPLKILTFQPFNPTNTIMTNLLPAAFAEALCDEVHEIEESDTGLGLSDSDTDSDSDDAQIWPYDFDSDIYDSDDDDLTGNTTGNMERLETAIETGKVSVRSKKPKLIIHRFTKHDRYEVDRYRACSFISPDSERVKTDRNGTKIYHYTPCNNHCCKMSQNDIDFYEGEMPGLHLMNLCATHAKILYTADLSRLDSSYMWTNDLHMFSNTRDKRVIFAPTRYGADAEFIHHSPACPCMARQHNPLNNGLAHCNAMPGWPSSPKPAVWHPCSNKNFSFYIGCDLNEYQQAWNSRHFLHRDNKWWEDNDTHPEGGNPIFAKWAKGTHYGNENIYNQNKRARRTKLEKRMSKRKAIPAGAAIHKVSDNESARMVAV